jgi:hypothetical protein
LEGQNPGTENFLSRFVPKWYIMPMGNMMYTANWERRSAKPGEFQRNTLKTSRFGPPMAAYGRYCSCKDHASAVVGQKIVEDTRCSCCQIKIWSALTPGPTSGAPRQIRPLQLAANRTNRKFRRKR